MKKSELTDHIKEEIVDILTTEATIETDPENLAKVKQSADKDDVIKVTEDDDFEKAKEADRLEKHPERDKIKAVQAMMDKEKKINENVYVDGDELRFHLDAYRKGDIDGDDLAQAVEEIAFGKITPPGMAVKTGEKMGFDMRGLDEDEDDDAYKSAKTEKGIAAKASDALAKQQKVTKIKDFIKSMISKGIVGKDKKIIDKDAYKKAFKNLK